MRLALDGISHHYREGTPVLNAVMLTLDSGSVVAVVGPSGSGKSTLLSIAGLVTRPTNGTVCYDNRVVTSRDAATLLGSRVAWLFQDNNVFGERSAADNVAIGLLASGVSWRHAREAASPALERVGLHGRDNDPVTKLSGGEAQRVGVARVLAQEPDLLICDEPTAQLDRSNSAEVFTALSAVRSTCTTVLIATHDLQVRKIADRVLELANGTIRDLR